HTLVRIPLSSARDPHYPHSFPTRRSSDLDSLLKENTEHTTSTDKGYYVSRECAEGFLSFHKKTTKRTATGIAIMVLAGVPYFLLDRKSTRLNSSHVSISYAVFCLKKKTDC